MLPRLMQASVKCGCSVSKCYVWRRRNASAGQPFLEVESGSQFGNELPLHELVPVQAINTGAEVLEKALSRPLFPLR